MNAELRMYTADLRPQILMVCYTVKLTLRNLLVRVSPFQSFAVLR